MEFVEGAAYVSPSRNKVYIYAAGQLHAHKTVNEPGKPAHWRDLGIGVYNDLVCIWKPGDPAYYIPTLVAEEGRAKRLAGIRFDVPNETSPDTATQVGPGTWDSQTGTAVFPVTLEIDKTSVIPRTWFYPTRYNERPGRYEDERGWLWTFVSGRRVWRCDAFDIYCDVPVYNMQEMSPIAVRWIGDLDE